jgi:DNA oxidative demethylase
MSPTNETPKDLDLDVARSPEGFRYHATFLSSDEQEALRRQLDQLTFEHDTFRGQRLKRGYAQFGYAYVSTGRRLTTAPPLPEFLAALRDRAVSLLDHPVVFNQCIVTHYPKGAGIGWHTDAPRFADTIIAISIGADATLEFRPQGTAPSRFAQHLTPGSLYELTGSARWDYQHQILPVKAQRHSITFRAVGP